MDSLSYSPRFDSNPLEDDSPDAWNQLVEALSPAAMLVCIRQRMSARMCERIAPEDLWQETLLHVWRDRARCEWRGIAAFRRFVLQVAENRIRNEADRIDSLKRGAGQRAQSLDPRSTGPTPPPVASTTPSRVASYLEEAELMRRALGSLPDEEREVVRLRYFEELGVEEVAKRLSIGVSAVKHRFRKGAAAYHRRVQALLEDRSSDCAEEPGD